MNFKTKLLVKPGTIPKFCKAQSVPIAIKGAIEGELNRLEAAGTVERVTHSDWAAPIVAVPKKDVGFCICGDYKVMVNDLWMLTSIPFQTPVNCLLHLLVARNLLSLTYRRLISNICWIRNQPSRLQSILINGYINIIYFLLVLPQLLLFSRKPWIPFFRIFFELNVILMTSW